MSKMWTGVTDGITNKIADDFNSSIRFDSKMYAQDIKGSMAHALMLCSKKIITPDDCEQIVAGLEQIKADIESGKLPIDYTAEDIHMFVESELTKRIGEVGKKLHTARSRNDQVALDCRMYLRDETDEIVKMLQGLIAVITNKAEQYAKTIMPGYTHLQRAQPITFGHHLMAYAMMLLRDINRFKDCRDRINCSPIGACALAGTTYDTDRYFEAKELGFNAILMNSIDAVADRDFCVEFCSACAITMMHLSRLSEELILWSSWEFKFVALPDAFTTGSSIMPQKKNPDMAELIRGKTGRVYGDLMGILTVLKGLPLAYNKDMQEDKEGVFDASETLQACLMVLTPMLDGMTANEENMLKACQKGFINATDLADYLVKKGLPFRSAYKISGQIVNKCLKEDKVLETLSLEEYKEFSPLFENDLYGEIDLVNCVNKRISTGGTSTKSVLEQIKIVKGIIGND